MFGAVSKSEMPIIARKLTWTIFLQAMTFLELFQTVRWTLSKIDMGHLRFLPDQVS